jgi:hypothetical protein
MSHLFVVVLNKWPVLSTYKRIFENIYSSIEGGFWWLAAENNSKNSRPTLPGGRQNCGDRSVDVNMY